MNSTNYFPRKADRPSRVTVPAHGHPLAKLLFSEMRRQRKTYSDLEWESGVLKGTFKRWRVDSNPGLTSIAATLGACGWLVLPVPRPETLPPELRADLEALADKYAVELGALEFIAAAAGRPCPITEQKRAA